MELHDASTWSPLAYLVFGTAVSLGMEILGRVVVPAFATSKEIPTNEMLHLDRFERSDVLCIMANKFLTVIFVYHLIHAVWHYPSVEWSFDKVTLLNTVVAMPCFYVVYDFFYTIFHQVLHHKLVYKFVHKHHHRQVVPTRGNYDAINVHPFEFLVGEYLHLLAIYAVPCHIITVAVFVAVSGVLASLNHTRYVLAIPGCYDVRNHDVHHRYYNANYGQYIMLWDRVFGWFRPYDSLPAKARAKPVAASVASKVPGRATQPAELGPEARAAKAA